MKPKPSLDIILGMGKPKPKADEAEPMDDMGEDDPKEAAFDELARAIKDGDNKAGVDAFKVLCGLMDDDSGDSEGASDA